MTSLPAFGLQSDRVDANGLLNSLDSTLDIVPPHHFCTLNPLDRHIHPSATSWLKRLIDIVGALVGLAIVAIIAIPIAIAIQLDSSGPIFYSQMRCGLNGRPFRMWKFRSMVAGGLPIPRADHIDAIAAMALEMQTAIQNFQIEQESNVYSSFNGSLALRIGINTGPVVAGVIGTQKFIYDLWGDTVNVASRMESQGEPGRIQVTAAIYERLQSKYVFEERGLISVKGRGEMKTYWLIGPK